MIKPYTMDDLARGMDIVKELHGLKGFAEWSEHIAKHLAAERDRSLKTAQGGQDG